MLIFLRKSRPACGKRGERPCLKDCLVLLLTELSSANHVGDFAGLVMVTPCVTHLNLRLTSGVVVNLTNQSMGFFGFEAIDNMAATTAEFEEK